MLYVNYATNANTCWMLTLLNHIGTGKFVMKLNDCLILRNGDFPIVWTLYAWEANNQGEAWPDGVEEKALRKPLIPGDTKNVRQSFLSRVTSRISRVMFTSLPATGGTLRKSRILCATNKRHCQTIHLQCIIRYNTCGVSSRRRCTVHRLLYENSDTRH